MLTSAAMYSFGATCWTPSGKQKMPRFLLAGSSLTVFLGLSCLQVISIEPPATLATKKDSNDIVVPQLFAASPAPVKAGARSAELLLQMLFVA